MNADRPEHFRYANGWGLVDAVYPESWEVDVRAAGGGLLRRCTVLGPRFPEVSTDLRPQWVMFGHAAAAEGQPWALPIASSLPGTREARAGYRYYEEVGHFRITVDQTGKFLEIRNIAADDENADGADVHRIIIHEEGGIVQLQTPSCRVTLEEASQSINVFAEETVQVDCKNARVHAGEDVEVDAQGNVEVVAFGEASVEAAIINADAPSINVTGGTVVNVAAPAINLTGLVTVV